MRLIDADKLRLSHCKECTLYPDKCLEENCDWGSIYHIDHAKTIDAIPISWIEKKIADIKETPNSDDIGCCYQINISEVWGWLLEDWREENERNENDDEL